MIDPDPENLINDRPALVEIDGQDPVFVASARTRDNGWLWVREWDGRAAKVPPHRVEVVRYLEIERYGEPDKHGAKPKRLASEKWRAEAKDRVADDNGQQPVIADD